ncbi:MAG: DUF3047 domain-containing protein [Planctomycetes bacterium]|nr:DUF3047 domain-containing protein [Planctomycetota bacterium]MCW8136060.1 DUF3047 domain-containing protein [Planctomycetota bacterium]
MKRALPVLAVLLAACTAQQSRHVVAVERLEAAPAPQGRVLDDFDDTDTVARWKLYGVEGGQRPLRHAHEDGALRLSSDSSAGVLWRQVGFDPGAEPLLSWRWKVSRTFGTSSPLSPELDNFPARLLVGFDHGWKGANPAALSWKRKVEEYTGVTPPARAICYTFGGELLSTEAVDATFGEGRIVVINLRSPAAQAGQWHHEVRDVASDYRAVFREDPPPVTALALGCDSHRVQLAAQAWFDDIVVYTPAAYPYFRSALAPPPAREHPLLTWLIVCLALLAAAGSGGWLIHSLRQRKQEAGGKGNYNPGGQEKSDFC